jgi:sugar/nucleoside kinase (ribokinase family)
MPTATLPRETVGAIDPLVKTVLAPFTAVVLGYMILNHVWRDIVLGTKNRMYPEYKPGGFPYETTRQARALGLGVSAVTMLGDDPAGDFLLDAMCNAGAAVQGIRRVSSPTPTAEVLVRGNERTILIDQKTQTAMLSFTLADRQVIAQADLVLAGGTLDHVGGDGVLTDVIRLARSCNKPLFLNPTRIHDPRTIDLRGVRLVQVSRDDFPHFGFAPDAPAAALAEALLERGTEYVVITDSGNGSWGFNHGENVRMFAVPVPQERISFPTGAGEIAFMSHAAGMMAGADMYTWLNLGALAGAGFIEHGHPLSRPQLLELQRAWPPEKRLVSRDHAKGAAKSERPANVNNGW